MRFLLLALICAIGIVRADDNEVTTSAEMEVPEWAGDSAMQLTLSSSKGGDSPLQYTVTPLTKGIGLNQSDQEREIVHISGSIIAADAANYNILNQPTQVAYLSCDDPTDDSFIQPEKMLNDLMGRKLKAIVLYSTSRNWCSLSYGGVPSYSSIFSMADAAEASQALGYLNGTSSGTVVEVLITGNTTNDQPTEKKKDGNHSAVAMSVLYSITGLITLLFLIIIASGAVRAHRHPERYGPRGALGGRPRQSRAKGLARAVLDTIPVVKFGNQTPAKPDPEIELENNTTDGRDATTQRTTSMLSDERHPEGVTSATTGVDQDGASAAARSSQAVDGPEGNEDEQLGCSICTEDFKVGEDVRVLPCRHQFHPTCIDPWLINVSGTCPLCRYDLRPVNQRDANERSSRDGENQLPPPLALDEYEAEGAQISHRHRLSRIFDVNRLRQASVEEQMAALRQMRAETNEAERQTGETDTRGQSSRLAERLRERFRIRTQAQSGEQRDT